MSLTARLTIPDLPAIGRVDPRIFGSFVEHMGRCVYEGVYDPDSPLADEDGFRTDVLEGTRDMGVTQVRYPGGNFVSTYNWKEGIGPKDQRPTRPDYAWKSIETNQFGTDEFIRWCRKANVAPMMTVNLGTEGASAAMQWLEYCNLPRGTYWADQRPEETPYAAPIWCLGNEMDGPWQAGHVPALEYAMRAQQAGKIMKGLDDSIETVLAGSSGRYMSTYMEWDREALDYCWEEVDFIAPHRYSENRRNDTAWFLAEGTEIERILTDYRSLIGFLRAKKRSNKQVFVSFDEWNVWYKNMETDGGWQPAPHLIEEVYNQEDALVVAQYLNAFIRNADLVRSACQAQLVNIIGPMLTRKDGLLKQTIYYAFRLFARAGLTEALPFRLDCDQIPAGDRGNVDVLDVSVARSEQGLSVFVVNRSQTESVTIDLGAAITSARILVNSDPKAGNSWENPTLITEEEGPTTGVVPPLSLVRFTL